ncbi:hypothetical protein LA080_000079 [Diaporthe eres]|uniref:Uncharacterized protein n=1 Tax=Diaporthe vaccinii TaxID=105482 RepID=A0ABR4EVS0_9PEZI|nr:hypothetical protein LA080_000079 [Diaporthe eres]
MTSVPTTGANALAWKQTTPGTFTRPLDTIESFFKWLVDLGVPLKREHWGVSLALLLSLLRWLKRDYVVDGEKGSRIAVGDVWLGGEMITPALCNHVWTWRDQMTLAAVFNTAYYEEAFVKQVHGGCYPESAVRSANLRLRYGNA